MTARKNKSFWPWHCIAIASILLQSCSSNRVHPSECSKPKWGHIPSYFYSNNWLINTPPNSTIGVCIEGSGSIGDLAYLVSQSVSIWAKAIGRDQYITATPECSQTANAIVTAHQPIPGDPNCSGATLAYATPHNQHVYMCNNYQNYNKAIMLHEVGHLWGLCDQYPGAEKTCDPNNLNLGDAALKSLMGANLNQGATLFQDDIEGIKALAKRQDMAGFQSWDALGIDIDNPGSGNIGGSGNEVQNSKSGSNTGSTAPGTENSGSEAGNGNTGPGNTDPNSRWGMPPQNQDTGNHTPEPYPNSSSDSSQQQTPQAASNRNSGC